MGHRTDSSMYADMVEALVAHGDVDRAVRSLMDRPDGDWCLQELLMAHGRVDDLRILIDRGERFAADALADVLVAQGKEAEARSLLTHGLTPDGRLTDAP